LELCSYKSRPTGGKIFAFRGAVHAVIAVRRMQMLVRRWRKTSSGSGGGGASVGSDGGIGSAGTGMSSGGGGEPTFSRR
jgi:uncharacterized membrane protein YgcG